MMIVLVGIQFFVGERSLGRRREGVDAMPIAA
jgi:hypothetical protein